MDVILKKSPIFILAAIVIGVIAFMYRPSYADGVSAEVPYAAKTAEYSESSGKAVVMIKWSTAYSKRKDGTISDVSGYEIQYASDADFSGARKILKGSTSNSAEIKLKDFDSKEEYDKHIDDYHFRVRSFVTGSRKNIYSKWAEATRVEELESYVPVSLNSITAERNTVTAEWDEVSDAQGYIVFGKKAGSAEWEKKSMIKDPRKASFKEKDLDYSCEYVYSVISYRKLTATDPSKFNTSYLKILSDEKNANKVLTEEFTMEKPALRAYFNKDILTITWYAAEGAENYHVEVSENKAFSNPRVFDIRENMLIEGMTSYTQELDDVERKDYYVRVRASGAFRDEDYYSEYSDVKLARYGAGLYTIKFDSNGGEGDMDSSLVSEDEEFRLPENEFSRDGYEFAGWSLEKDSQTILDNDQPILLGEPDHVDEDTVKGLAKSGGKVTLYACWEGSGPEAAADWAAVIASDDEFIYGKRVKSHCWFCQGGEKTYICNAFVAAAYTHGMPYFRSYRAGSTDYNWWLKNGFKDVGENVPASEIRKGDVICCWTGRRWGHIMIAITDGTADDPRVAHAARKGTDPASVREDNIAGRLKRYPKYHVVRMNMEDTL